MRSLRPLLKPSSKVPTMSLTKSSTPSIPFPTSSPSHWPSSEFAERSSYRHQFHSQLSVPLGPAFSHRSPTFLPPARNRRHPQYLSHAKLSPGSTTSAVPKSRCVDGVTGALDMGQQKSFPDFQRFLGLHHSLHRCHHRYCLLGNYNTTLVFSPICVWIVHLPEFILISLLGLAM